MIHLIGFAPESPQQAAFTALYREGDICVFSDAGLLFASTLSLKGDGYLLQHPALAMPEDLNLPVIDHSQLLDLVAEHGPCTSWY
ncbi:MAG: hypothetical protein VX793_01720 [Pseudomonadota bacterium]|nr:hypothetical protein [Pseudomonadota bacterium]